MHKRIKRLMNELDLTGNCLADQFFSFVKKKFVFFKKVVSMGINGDDERSEMTDAAGPEGFRHSKLRPVGSLNFFHGSSSSDGTSCRKNAVNGLVFLAGAHSFRAHAAFSYNEPDTGLADKFFFKFFHAHTGGRADGDDLICR